MDDNKIFYLATYSVLSDSHAKITPYGTEQAAIHISAKYISLSTSLHHRIAGLSGNTASIVLVPGHVDVPVHAPAGAPTVLHQPEVLQKKAWRTLLSFDFGYLWFLI